MSGADDRERVIDALTRRTELADWSVAIVTTRAAWRQRSDGDGVAEGAHLERAIVATVHRDLPAGRGTATVRLDPDASLDDALVRASARAAATLGPSWRASPPAAPARVELADPSIAPTDPAAALDRVEALLDDARGERALLDGTVAIESAEHELYSQRGQRAQWRSTAIRVDATLGPLDRRSQLACVARRLDDLALAAAVARATAPLATEVLAPGTYPLALTAAALLDGDRGLLEAFVAQADPQLERQGLARYRVGAAIADGATLTVHSDGALPFGWHSAPLGADGEPVRRFPLVVAGVAADLGLDARAAALRGRTPNGGVRGLVVEPGPDDDLVDDATVVIDRLSWLEIDRVTGWFRAGFPHARRGRAALGPGILRGDAIALLARARRSAATFASPSYRGPALWHLGPVAID